MNFTLFAKTTLTRLRITPKFSGARFNTLRTFSSAPEPLTVQQVENRVLDTLKAFSKVNQEKIKLDSNFTTDLGLDSLDQVEIVMALEDEFSIEIPDRDAESIMTPREAVEKIYADKNAI